MKKLLSVLLLLAMIFALCACGGQETSAPATEATQPASNIKYPEIKEKLTWDAINAFPIKTEDMTVEEMRDLCVDFFYFSKTALWIPDQNWQYAIASSGNPDEMIMGRIYGGLPYITNGGGNIYRLMDYIDEETGVVDMTEPMENPTLFGNQCSYGSYWGWARVINSAAFNSTPHLVQKNGFLRVGPYTYDDNIMQFVDTFTIVNENGAQIMCQSYAALQHGDGVVYFKEDGHVMMIQEDPVVVYTENNEIDAGQSYVYILDQHGAWTEYTNDSGDTFLHKNYINRKFTFNELMSQGYLPFTFGEFLGTDPVEATECTFSHTADTIKASELNAGEVVSNYGVSDIYAVLKDAEGNTVLSVASREHKPTKTLNFFKKISSAQWEPYADGNHTVEVVCQLGTGERLTIYTGKLVK